MSPKPITPGMHERHTRWGQRVRALRKQFGISQQALADGAEVSQQTIANIEAGNHGPSDDLKIGIAWVFGADPDDLFSLSA